MDVKKCNNCGRRVPHCACVVLSSGEQAEKHVENLIKNEEIYIAENVIDYAGQEKRIAKALAEKESKENGS